jgi:four helix bundle protein
MKNFRSLNAAIKLYQNIKSLKLKGEVRSQIERASLSTCLNLSEGNAKLTAKDRSRFFNIAYASNKEVETILMIINQKELYTCAHRLGGMLYMLQKNAVSQQQTTARST